MEVKNVHDDLHDAVMTRCVRLTIVSVAVDQVAKCGTRLGEGAEEIVISREISALKLVGQAVREYANAKSHRLRKVVRGNRSVGKGSGGV